MYLGQAQIVQSEGGLSIPSKRRECLEHFGNSTSTLQHEQTGSMQLGPTKPMCGRQVAYNTVVLWQDGGSNEGRLQYVNCKFFSEVESLSKTYSMASF